MIFRLFSSMGFCLFLLVIVFWFRFFLTFPDGASLRHFSANNHHAETFSRVMVPLFSGILGSKNLRHIYVHAVILLVPFPSEDNAAYCCTGTRHFYATRGVCRKEVSSPASFFLPWSPQQLHTLIAPRVLFGLFCIAKHHGKFVSKWHYRSLLQLSTENARASIVCFLTGVHPLFCIPYTLRSEMLDLESAIFRACDRSSKMACLSRSLSPFYCCFVHSEHSVFSSGRTERACTIDDSGAPTRVSSGRRHNANTQIVGSCAGLPHAWRKSQLAERCKGSGVSRKVSKAVGSLVFARLGRGRFVFSFLCGMAGAVLSSALPL